MSLLNRPSDGIHSVLIVIFKLLLEKSLSREKIIGLCAPAGSTAEGQVRNTLNRWLELGLFQENEKNDQIAIHADVIALDRDPRKLGRLARRLLLRAENNVNLWAAEGARAADFTRTLCWFLAQDVWSSELAGWDQTQLVIQSQMPPGLTLVQNDTRWSGFKAWAPFLGFAWSPRFGGGDITPDPADAIRDVLPSIFTKKLRTIPAEDFIDLLARELPVLDGGEYRLAVEEQLASREDPEAWQGPPHGCLSSSLSRALMRLEEEGILKNERLADSQRRVALTGRGRARLDKDISQFTYLG